VSARGCEVRHGRRHDDAIELLQVLAQRREVLRLLAVIELTQERLAELVHHLLELVEAAGFGMPVEELRDLRERIEVIDDLFADAGPLDFHGDRAAVAQGRTMDLAE
jgi:hypothetical protein